MSEPAQRARQLQRAKALVQLRRFGDAEALLRPMIATDPEDSEVLRILAAVLNDSGRPAEALPVIRRAVALAPDAALAHAVRSTIERSNGDLDAAVAAADRAIALAPHWPVGYARKAWALADRQPSAAVESARRAVELAPGHADYTFVLGYAALQDGRQAEAEQCFRATLAIEPDHSMAQNNLAVIEVRRKNVRGALAGFRGAVGTDPRNRTAVANFEAIGRNVVQVCLRLATMVGLIFILCWGFAGSHDEGGAETSRAFFAVVAGVSWWLVLGLGVRVVPRDQLRVLMRLSVRGSSWPACVAIGGTLVLPAAGGVLGWDGVVYGAWAAAGVAIVVRFGYVVRVLGRLARRVR